jgi:hypothetical protein
MTDAAAIELVDAEELKSLERAADGLSPSGVASALIGAGVDPDRGLAGVPRSMFPVVEGCLIAAFRTDARTAVASHLGPLGSSGDLHEKAIALSEARNQGRAFDEAQAAYNQALTADAAAYTGPVPDKATQRMLSARG